MILISIILTITIIITRTITTLFKDNDFIPSINQEIILVYYKYLEQCTYDVINPYNVIYNKLVQESSDNKEVSNSKDSKYIQQNIKNYYSNNNEKQYIILSTLIIISR